MNKYFALLLVVISLTLTSNYCWSTPPTRWQSFRTLVTQDSDGIWHFSAICISALSVLRIIAFEESYVRDSLDAADAGDFSAWNRLLLHLMCAGAGGVCGYHVKGFLNRFESFHQQRLMDYVRNHETDLR